MWTERTFGATDAIAVAILIKQLKHTRLMGNFFLLLLFFFYFFFFLTVAIYLSIVYCIFLECICESAWVSSIVRWAIEVKNSQMNGFLATKRWRASRHNRKCESWDTKIEKMKKKIIIILVHTAGVEIKFNACIETMFGYKRALKVSISMHINFWQFDFLRKCRSTDGMSLSSKLKLQSIHFIELFLLILIATCLPMGLISRIS